MEDKGGAAIMPIRPRHLKTAVKLSATVSWLTLSFSSFAHADDDTVLSVGIVPQQSASRLAAMWVPVLKEWSMKSGHHLQFATAKDIPTFEACLTIGAYDIAYMNPYHYTVFHEASGYEAFAKQSDKQLKGLLVAHHDSEISKLSDLEGVEVAFPSPAAFGASVIPRAELRKNGVMSTPKYVNSHDSVYRAVSAGLMPAGGGVLRTFKTVAPAIRAQLKIVYETDGYTPHAFAAHPETPKSTIDAIFTAMTATSEQKPDVIARIGMVGVEAARNEDWNDVRALNLQDSHTNVIHDDSIKCHSD
ncbi:MAG: phosphate/phosphite/phosphonate ABC transporter substrate-binding protein [Pseudomonadota bacterium]